MSQLVGEAQLNPKQQSENSQNVFIDVYRLLEDYAPSWYSDELRERFSAAVMPQGTRVRAF